MRWATLADRQAIDSHLREHISGSMFPVTNLKSFGMDGGHPRAMSFVMTGQGVVGISDEGMVMPQSGPETDWAGVAQSLRGRSVMGVLGQTRQVRPLIDALGFRNTPKQMDDDEPHFDVTPDSLVMPNTGDLQLLPMAEAPFELMVEWRTQYAIGLIGEPPDRAPVKARADVEAFIARDTHRVLVHQGQCVATTGFNAVLPDIVQVGAVYTPPPLRGRGFARAAVALHLQEAFAKGARRAILFSGSDPATRAYRAIGFREIGAYSIVVFRQAQEAAR